MKNDMYSDEFVAMMRKILSGTGLEKHVESLQFPVVEKATGFLWFVVDGSTQNGVALFTLHNPVSKKTKQALAIEVWFLSPVDAGSPKSPEATLEVWAYSPTCKTYEQAIEEDCVDTMSEKTGSLEDMDALFRLATLETALFNAELSENYLTYNSRIEYVLRFNDGTEEVVKTRILKPGFNRPGDDLDRREMAMQLGMGLGVDAYNEAMGYDVGRDEDALESERFETCSNHEDDFDMF